MKYITPEIWLGWNSSDDAESRRFIELSEQNFLAYAEQLRTLEPRLSKRNYKFFTEESLHDGRLLAFTAGDAVGRQHHNFNINRHDTTAVISVIGPNLDAVYTLSYRNLRRAYFDYPTTAPLFHAPGNHIGDWGYDELTAVDENYFQHEILFASGTSILIEFKKFSYTKTRIAGSRYESVKLPLKER